MHVCKFVVFGKSMLGIKYSSDVVLHAAIVYCSVGSFISKIVLIKKLIKFQVSDKQSIQ